MATSLWPYAKYPFYFASGLAALASGALYCFQKHSSPQLLNRISLTPHHSELIYPRNLPPGARTEVPRPAQFGLNNAEELTLSTPDGERISAFLIKPDSLAQARPITVVSFHGNAGNVGHRLPIARILSNELLCNTLMVEYRGYGLSTGSPDEEGLAIDAQTALDFVRSRDDLKDTKIVIYGQSLGGAVSIDLVAKNKGTGDIKALILENTFLSIAKMIPSVFPIAKYLTPLCHQYWRSEEMLPQITDVPVLFLSGLQDEIVPPSHMKGLFRACRSKQVVWKEFPKGDHNNTVGESGYFEAIAEFLERYVDKK